MAPVVGSLPLTGDPNQALASGSSHCPAPAGHCGHLGVSQVTALLSLSPLLLFDRSKNTDNRQHQQHCKERGASTPCSHHVTHAISVYRFGIYRAQFYYFFFLLWETEERDRYRVRPPRLLPKCLQQLGGARAQVAYLGDIITTFQVSYGGAIATAFQDVRWCKARANSWSWELNPGTQMWDWAKCPLHIAQF